ncbi:porin family protein [Rufibacter roseus]|uniref:Porin family protein n=1 Tax=Rufibacter roseus TaxID=1567108 RepID=A0ABW2DGJ6_9BACT|nr:porin family protein [Rufibacter roseus]
MKKLLLLAVFSLSCVCGHAQTGFSLGVKAGGNYTGFTGEDVPAEAKYKFGFHAGAIIEYALTPSLSIRPEMLYSLKGTSMKFMGPDWESINWETVNWEEYMADPEGYEFEVGEKEYHFKETLHYIDVPVLAHYKVGNLFLQAGPTASFFISSKSELDGDSTPDDEETAGGNDYRKVDFGYALGIGYQLSHGLEVSARYNGGITNVDKNNNYKAKNSVFQLSLAYIVGKN